MLARLHTATAMLASLLAWSTGESVQAQTTLADFTGNAIPAGWTTANTNTSVLTLAPANGRLEFSTAPLLTAASTATNYAAISSPWGISSKFNFKLKMKCRFVRQNYPYWQQNQTSVTENVGILAHLTTVDTFIGTVMPDGLALSLGSTWETPYGNWRWLALSGINAGTPTTINERYGSNNFMSLESTPPYTVSIPETDDAYLYISYVASTGTLRFSFTSFEELAPYAFQYTPNNPSRRPLRLSLGGFTTGKVRAMLGSQAWIDDVVLQEGLISYRPTGLSASQGTSTTSIDLTWTATPNATSYKVYRAGILIGTPTTTTFSDTTAQAGANLSYFIRAVSEAGDSESSAVVTGWRNVSAPTGLIATDGTITNGVNLNWTAVPGVMGYKIYRSTGSIVPTYSGSWNTTACVDNSAIAGTLYNYAITAVTAAGESAMSTIDTGWRKPLPPTSVNASDGATGGVTVTWAAAANATAYKVFRAVGTATAAPVGTVTAPSLTYTDTSALEGVLYNYSVRTSGQAGTGDSDASAVNSGWRSFPAPVGLAASAGSSTSGVNLSWSASPGATSYKIFRGVGGATTQIGTPTTALSFVDTTATPGTVYTYAVKGTATAGDSPASTTVTGYRALSAPASATATDGTSPANVTVTWPASTGATGYKIFRAIGTDAPVQIGTTTTALTFPDTTAAPGTIYNYSVKATGAAGVADSATSAANAGYRALSAPTSVAATDGTSTSEVTLTWAASTGAISYTVFRGIGSASAAIGTVTALTYSDTSATPGVVYTYAVKASGASGVADSAASVVNTGYRSVSAPTSVAATNGASTANVTVSWAAPSGATSYKIFRAVGGATAAQIGTATALTYTDATAVPGTIYTYSVKGVSAAGDSVASATATGYRALSAPASVAATVGTSLTAVTVTWPASTGAAGYKIFRAIGAGTAVQIGTTTTALTLADNDAVPGTIYTYSVKASGSVGVADSAASATNTGYRALSAPTSVAATDGDSSASVTVTWAASSGASSYKIYRGTTLANTVAAPATSYADTLGTAGTVFAYTVKAAGPTGVNDSAASTADNGWRNLPAPTGLIASDNLTTKINVKWNAVTGATGYKVYRGTTAGALTLLTTIAAGTTLTFDDTNAAVGTTYTYAVTARSAAGDSAQSATDTGVRVAGSMTAGSSKPQDGGDDGYAPNTTEAVTEEPEIAPMGVQRYVQVIAITRDAAQACDAEADAQTTVGNTTDGEATDGEGADPTNAPAIIDLDRNGEPDLCQLRRGDLDLNGRLDEADLALLLTMIGEEPVLGFGDLNGDGVIDGSDVQALSERMDALVNTN